MHEAAAYFGKAEASEGSEFHANRSVDPAPLPEGDGSFVWRAYRDADPATKEELVSRYLPLVRRVASRLSIGLPVHVELDDLFSYGTFGLLDALERFDPQRGVKFETYAYTRVRGAILDGLRAMDWVPSSLRQRARKVEDAIWAVERRACRAAQDAEVAAELGLALDELQNLLTEIERAQILSLDEGWTTDEDRGEPTLRDVVGDEHSQDPLESAEREERKAVLGDAIERLPEKERLVVSMYYYDELMPKEIAAVLNLSVSRISQLHTKALLRLRAALAHAGEAV